MSVYSTRGKGWRYDFILNAKRYAAAGFKTKREAKQAEAMRREEIKNPKTPEAETTPTDMAFLDLVNNRLDYIEAYHSRRYYTDHIYLARKWVKKWKKLDCSEITPSMIQDYLMKRAKAVSNYTANAELRSLRALFNFGMHPVRGWIEKNPTRGIPFFPVEKRIKYVPPKEDVLRVIMAADHDTRDYLWTIALTLARVGEVNRLTWNDVNLDERYVVLYTRKKRGGHLTPRKIPMIDKLHGLMSKRHASRDKNKPWVFWHRHWDRKKRVWTEKPYEDRKTLMRLLCKKANVKYFRFHALRHFGASVLDNDGVPIGSIQRLLGHENRTTTEIYLHSIGNAEIDAMRVLNNHFSASEFEKVPHQVPHQQKRP